MSCRHCGADLDLRLVDLGHAPPSNAYLSVESLRRPEVWFPLRVMVCRSCWLVQIGEPIEASSMFDAEYAYFSGYSTSWLAHCSRYAEAMTDRLGLSSGSTVLEIAANDGSLLRYFHERGIRCLGVEPTASSAAAARALGLEVREAFFGLNLAHQLRAEGFEADLMAANNVLAHVPDINDFTAGFAALLSPTGVATFEFPHLLRLVDGGQFDTIYHEHYSYLSLLAVENIFKRNGLAVFDVEELVTHGGSLRVYAQRADTAANPVSSRVLSLREAEREAGMAEDRFYQGFQSRAEAVKNELLAFLLEVRRQGRKVAAYGAAAKGNTMLNFAGVRDDLLQYVVDRNPAKQGRFLPGSHIPIVDETRLAEDRPDYVLILPWNLREEVSAQLAYARRWGARFVTAVPTLDID